MEMTIKQLANQLGVSKTTISKAISALGLQGELKRSGNKYLLSDVQIELVKSQIENQKTQTESEKSQIQVQKSKTANQELQTEYQNLRFQDQKMQLENQKSLIEVLQKQLALLNEQLGIKDEQIRAYQEQIRILTDSLHDATAALSAEQALHAGTIQRQLVEQSSKEDVSPEEQTQPKQKQSFLSRIFEKRSK
jgi:biotin operon repressor